MKRYFLQWILVLLCVLCAASAASAQWVKDGIPVGSADNNQDNPIAPDGAGGAMIAWRDNRNGNYHIYGNRVGANGYVYGGAGGHAYLFGRRRAVPGGMRRRREWCRHRRLARQPRRRCADLRSEDRYDRHHPLDGRRDQCLPVRSYPGELAVIPDGAGGAFITWQDFRNGNHDIYAQRIDGSGTVLWSDAGRPVCTNTSEQYSPKIAPDGSGGAVIGWRDSYMGSSLYAQRIDGAGTALWDTAGVAVSPRTASFMTCKYAPTPGVSRISHGPINAPDMMTSMFNISI